MNECYIIGKIIGNIRFEFIHQEKENKNNSIVLFSLKTLDKNILKIKGYNEIADFCYSKLQNNDIVFIEGKLETEGIITVKVVYKIKLI